MDPGAGRRSGDCIDEDPHGRERVRHADQSTDTRQVGRMTKEDRTHPTSHAGVKEEFVERQAGESMRMETLL